jgi:hypothetical protein
MLDPDPDQMNLDPKHWSTDPHPERHKRKKIFFMVLKDFSCFEKLDVLFEGLEDSTVGWDTEISCIKFLRTESSISGVLNGHLKL